MIKKYQKVSYLQSIQVSLNPIGRLASIAICFSKVHTAKFVFYQRSSIYCFIDYLICSPV